MKSLINSIAFDFVFVVKLPNLVQKFLLFDMSLCNGRLKSLKFMINQQSVCVIVETKN